MSYDIRSIQLTPDAMKQYAEFLGYIFQKPTLFTPEYLDWQYNQNPDGVTIGFNAFTSDEQLVAHYVAQPLQAILQGKLTRGLLSYHTATHHDHSGQGLFTTLAKKTYQEAQALGYEFVIGVSNQNSTHGFVKNLDFQWVAPLKVKIGFGKVKFSSKTEYEYKKHWTAEALQWRLQGPKKSYYVKAHRESLEIFTLAMAGLKIVLGNFVGFPLEFKQTTAGLHLTKIWMGLDDQMSWRRGIFINLPNRLKPSPLNLIFKDLTGQNRQLDQTNIKFQALDFDAF